MEISSYEHIQEKGQNYDNNRVLKYNVLQVGKRKWIIDNLQATCLKYVRFYKNQGCSGTYIV